MKPEQFFDSEGESSGNGSNAPTTLTYNYAGEQITVDLSNPDQVKLAQDRLSKGHNMEKIAEERNKLKEQAAKLQQTVDAWNSRLEAAKSDPLEFNALVNDLENYIGKSLTRQEKQDLADADLDVTDPMAKKLIAMEKAFTSYREEQERKEQLREKTHQEETTREYARQLVSELDRMEKDKATYPGFDREAIYNKAVETGTTDFEMVYFFLNRDNFIKSERDKIEAEFKNLTDKRKAAATEGDTSPASLEEPPKTFKKIEDVGKSVMEEMKKSGKSFFSE
jgi:hypothetical protein